MADPNDVRATKAARSEMGRRGIDMTLADIRVTHGVVYIRGTVRALRGSNVRDIRSEMELIARVLRQKAEVRDVVLDCMFRGE
jgi:hypothetical protein